MALLRGQAKQ